MLKARFVSGHLATLALFVNLPPAYLGAQIPRRSQIFSLGQPPSERQVENLRSAELQPGSVSQLIATATARFDREGEEIRVYREGRPVSLSQGFYELLAVAPRDRKTALEKLVGRSVALVPSEKLDNRLDVYVGVGGTYELTLADNIFKVSQVLVSSRKSPIEVRMDGKVHRLKPGEVLLVM